MKMEPVAVIDGTRKRESVALDIDWTTCFICQSNRKNEKTTKPTDVGLERFKDCVIKRQKYHDHEYITTLDRIQSINIDDEKKHIVWHRGCYSKFTHANHIERLKNRYEKNAKDSCDQPSTCIRLSSRAMVAPVSWDKCIFCQEDKSGKQLRNVATLETSDRILNGAQKNEIMRCRLAGINDLIAAEGKYHLPCYVTFRRKSESTVVEEGPEYPPDVCFNKIIEEVDAGLSGGDIYTMKTIWHQYCNMMRIEFGVCVDQCDRQSYRAFKNKVKRVLEDRADFAQSMNQQDSLLVFPLIQTGIVVQNLAVMADELEQSEIQDSDEIPQHIQSSFSAETKDNELLSWLYRVAVKMRNDIKTMPGHSDIGDINTESAQKVVPESLYIFLRLLCDCDSKCEDFEGTFEGDEGGESKRILSIAQDIVCLASGGRKQTPKQLGLALTVHQATRSKDLVQLMHAAGHGVSYETVRRADTALANSVLARYVEQNNTIIPLNFAQATYQGYIRYANDNIDIIEETLDGQGSFHASQSAAFRRSIPGEKIITPDVKSSSSRSVTVPEHFNEIQPSGMGNQKPEATFPVAVKSDWYMESDTQAISEAMAIDISWLLARQSHSEDQHVPGWTAFNQRVSDVNPAKTTVGPMPIINEPAHEFDTIWTVIQNCQRMTAALEQTYTVLTFDEQLYCKAKMLQWAKPDECKNLVVMLGGFHIQMNFTKIIGQYMADSGLKDILVESGVYGENTAESILNGKQWNRTIRAHKLVFEALWRILWQKILHWLNENEVQIDADINQVSEDLSRAFQQADDEAIYSALRRLVPKAYQVSALIEDMDREHETNATFVYWRQYMHLVSILLRFTRAIRDAKWELFLTSFREMLPWFGAFDHPNYLRWGSVFLADMNQLVHTAPEVLAGFKEGDFGVKESTQKFNQIPDDQGLEHVNKMGKIAGGVIGITRSETALNRWGLTYIDRARIADETRDMLGVAENNDDDQLVHKESGKARLLRDESDVQSLMSMFQRFEVFNKESEELVCLTTGDIANAAIKKDLLCAEKVGLQVIRTFVTERFIEEKTSLHTSIPKQKLKTFASMCAVEVSKDKKKKGTAIVKADRDLFQRLIVVMESGRDIDIDSLLTQELCHVPLALANTDGTLRQTNKSQLLPLLEKDGVSQANAPASNTPTCTIVDGMALVQALGKPKDTKTFGDYAKRVLSAVLSSFKEPCNRVDVVFDCYEKYSIKDATRKRRVGKGHGIRCEITNRDLKLPEQWKSFMDVNDNKVALTKLLKDELLAYQHEATQELVVSGGNNGMAASSTGRNMEHLCSSQEEADTRMILHALEAKARGYERIIITSSDTDVLLLLMAFQPQLPEEVWMKSGTSKYRRYIAGHKIDCPDDVRDSLLAFHAITGCDSTSQLAGISKKAAWKIFCEVPHLLSQLGVAHVPSDEVCEKAEEFVCRLYNPKGNAKKIQALRCSQFRKVGKKPENMPPTEDALHQHILRAHHQALVWRNANVPNPGIPNPTTSGWYLEDSQLMPRLMTKEGLTAECVKIATCACISKCRPCLTGRCKCKKNGLRCTLACKCADLCRNPLNDSDSD